MLQSRVSGPLRPLYSASAPGRERQKANLHDEQGQGEKDRRGGNGRHGLEAHERPGEDGRHGERREQQGDCSYFEAEEGGARVGPVRTREEFARRVEVFLAVTHALGVDVVEWDSVDRARLVAEAWGHLEECDHASSDDATGGCAPEMQPPVG